MNDKDNEEFGNARPDKTSEAGFTQLMGHETCGKDSDLNGAILAGFRLREVSWKGKDLSFADLTGADLSHADLSEADLTIAEMTLADLRGANLRGANLFGTDLFGANLSGANLTGAWLGGAELDEANLFETILVSASYDCDTHWPEDFDPEACGATLVICSRMGNCSGEDSPF